MQIKIELEKNHKGEFEENPIIEFNNIPYIVGDDTDLPHIQYSHGEILSELQADIDRAIEKYTKKLNALESQIKGDI